MNNPRQAVCWIPPLLKMSLNVDANYIIKQTYQSGFKLLTVWYLLRDNIQSRVVLSAAKTKPCVSQTRQSKQRGLDGQARGVQRLRSHSSTALKWIMKLILMSSIYCQG